jgi:hypothetical protein
LGGATIAMFALMGPAPAATVTIDLVEGRTAPEPVSPFPLTNLGIGGPNSFVSWAMMTLGFASVGFMAYRQRNTAMLRLA